MQTMWILNFPLNTKLLTTILQNAIKESLTENNEHSH